MAGSELGVGRGSNPPVVVDESSGVPTCSSVDTDGNVPAWVRVARLGSRDAQEAEVVIALVVFRVHLDASWEICSLTRGYERSMQDAKVRDEQFPTWDLFPRKQTILTARRVSRRGDCFDGEVRWVRGRAGGVLAVA